MITQKFDSNVVVVVVLKTTTSFKFPSYVDYEKELLHRCSDILTDYIFLILNKCSSTSKSFG